MMAAPLISVIIPVYNTEKYLRQCLTSVTEQTHSALQIICVNDGSTDNSLALLEEMGSRDKRIHIVSQPNMGPPAARRAALAHASGEYVYFCDSDDWIERNYLEKMLHVLQAKNLNVLFNKNIIKYAGGTKQPFRDCKDIHEDGVYAFEHISPALWARLYRKSFIVDCFNSIPGTILLEDVYIHYTAIRMMDQFHCIIGPSYYYRFHDNSVMTRYVRSFDMITVVAAIYALYKKNNILKKYHIPFELLYNKIESHTFKIEFQNKIRALLSTIGDDFWENSRLYHGYTLTLTKAFLAGSPDEDLTPKLRAFALGSLRDNLKK